MLFRIKLDMIAETNRGKICWPIPAGKNRNTGGINWGNTCRDKYSLGGLTHRRSHLRRGDHIYPRAITSCPGHALCLTWQVYVHAAAITFVPGVEIPCKTLQLLAPGTNVIAAACTFNLPGQAQGMPWARFDRPGVNVIAPA